MVQKDEHLLKALCEQASHEQDGKKLMKLVAEITDLLDGKQQASQPQIPQPTDLVHACFRFFLSQFAEIVIVTFQPSSLSSKKKSRSVASNSAFTGETVCSWSTLGVSREEIVKGSPNGIDTLPV